MRNVLLLLVVTNLWPASLRAEAALPDGNARLDAVFAELMDRALDLKGPRKRSDQSHTGIEKLREAMGALPRERLSDGQWIDFHIALRKIDHALSKRPPRKGARGDPIGRQRFDYKLRFDHGLDLDADDLEMIGEVAYHRTIQELEDLAREIDPSRTWQELAESARQDSPASPSELLPMVRDLTLAAWKFTERDGWVSVPDVATALGLRLAAKRGDKPYAWYQPGRIIHGRFEGDYVVTPVPEDASESTQRRLLGDVNSHWMTLVSLHEGIPGHHLQHSVAAAQPLSKMRHEGYTSVYIEGWGLYCEQHMVRRGFVQDPITRITQLRMRLWRSARVIIDVGIHTKGMTHREATDMLADEVLLDRRNAQREVDRYYNMPTQPMSYVLGWMQLDTIRQMAKKKAGDAFDERAFHDRFLSFGPIPIDLAGAVLLDDRREYDRLHP